MAVKVTSTIRRSNPEFQILVSSASADVSNRLAQTTFNSAVQIAPHSGPTRRPAGHKHIRGNHRIERATPNSPRARVINDAPHSRLVHEGRRAFSKPYRMKWINDGGRWPGRQSHSQIGAAKAQPWLVEAYNRARVIQDLTNVTPMNTNRSPL